MNLPDRILFWLAAGFVAAVVSTCIYALYVEASRFGG